MMDRAEGTGPARSSATATGSELGAGVLDAISARAVVLDGDGCVVSLNRAWRDYETERGVRSALRLGENFFEAISSENCPDWWGGSRAATGILSVLTGRRARFAAQQEAAMRDAAAELDAGAE